MARHGLSMHGNRFHLIIFGVWMACSGATAAAPAIFSVGVDSRFTNNAGQSPFNEQSDLESRVSVGVQQTSDSGPCNSDLAASVAYARWLDETFGPETNAEGNFQGDCAIGSTLVWQVSDYLRDVARDTRVSNTPNNRTQKNVFRTGPLLTFRIGAVDELFLSAAYENTEFREPEEVDGERYSGTIGWNHFFSSSFTAGLGAGVDQSELDTEEEIDRVTVSVPFTKTWAATSLTGAMGYGQIKSSLQNSAPRRYESFVGNLLLVRQVNVSTELELEASRELTDQTSDFDARFDDFVFNLNQTSAVEVTAVRFGVNNALSGASTFDIGMFVNQSDYLDLGIEEEGAGVEADFRRPLTGQLSWTGGARYEFFRYSADATEDELFRAAIGIDFQLNRRIDFVSRVGYEDRTSDVINREYDEAWVLVGVQYQFR